MEKKRGKKRGEKKRRSFVTYQVIMESKTNTIVQFGSCKKKKKKSEGDTAKSLFLKLSA